MMFELRSPWGPPFVMHMRIPLYPYAIIYDVSGVCATYVDPKELVAEKHLWPCLDLLKQLLGQGREQPFIL